MPAIQDDSKRNRRTAKRMLAIGLPLVVIAGTGIGYAYWTGGGNGTGTATTANPTDNLGFTRTGTLVGLAPGVADQAFGVDVQNNGSASARISQVVATVDSISNAPGTCVVSDYVISNGTMNITPVDLAPTATASFTGASIQFFNKANTNQNGCKGATVNIKFVAS